LLTKPESVFSEDGRFLLQKILFPKPIAATPKDGLLLPALRKVGDMYPVA
jgi:hypothetical protein